MYSLYSPGEKQSVWKRLSARLGLKKVDSQFFISGELNYESILAEFSQIVCIKDKEGVYQMANQAFCDLAGIEKHLILGKNDNELGLFLNPDQIMQADSIVFETKQKKHIPIEPFTDKYGSLYWFRTNKIPLFDENGEVLQVLIISNDITKQTEDEQKLKRSELRYKSIFQNNYSGIIVVNSQLEILNKNTAFVKLLEMQRNVSQVDDLATFISGDDKADLLDLLSGLVSRNYEYFDLSLELNAKDGKKVNTICFVRGLYDNYNRFTEAVVTFQDITEDLKNRRAVEQSEERFRVIVENATEALLLLDFDAKQYIDVNKNAEKLFGYSREELLNLKLGELSPMNQGDGTDSMESSKGYMEKAISGEEVVYEWITKTKDNRFIPCEVRLGRLPYENKNIVRTSVIDITARKKAEKMLNIQMKKLESSNEKLQKLNGTLENQTKQLQEFAYISSHNLRSPAGNIRALLDFYQSEPSQENLDIVLEKLDVVSVNLLDTINDLAEVVKIKNEVSKERSNISIEKLINKTKASLSQQIKDKAAKIEIDMQGVTTIHAPRAYMESVFLNLISNAIKYSKEEIAPVIKIVSSKKGENLVIKVIDNGIGLDLKKYENKIFGLRNTFHRNKDSRGVGLFITKAQIESIGGSIIMSSIVGEGSTFTIELPEDMIL